MPLGLPQTRGCFELQQQQCEKPSSPRTTANRATAAFVDAYKCYGGSCLETIGANFRNPLLHRQIKPWNKNPTLNDVAAVRKYSRQTDKAKREKKSRNVSRKYTDSPTGSTTSQLNPLQLVWPRGPALMPLMWPQDHGAWPVPGQALYSCDPKVATTTVTAHADIDPQVLLNALPPTSNPTWKPREGEEHEERSRMTPADRKPRKCINRICC